MSESSNVLSFARPVGEAIADFMQHPEGRGERRVVWYTSKNRRLPENVLISWEAQCAVARSIELTTDEIFERHAGDFDRQIALMVASREAPSNGVWTLDASDIVPII